MISSPRQRWVTRGAVAALASLGAMSGMQAVPGLAQAPTSAAGVAYPADTHYIQVTTPPPQSGAVGAAVSLPIRATDSVAGQTLTYAATGLPPGLSTKASTGVISGYLSMAGDYRVTVSVTDTTGGSGSTVFDWWASNQQLENTGFEDGLDAIGVPSWTVGGTAAKNVVVGSTASEPANSGSYLAKFAAVQDWSAPFTQSQSLTQTVVIPPACRNAVLSFWLKGTTSLPPGATDDTLKVDVLDPGGHWLATVATFSDSNATGSYAQYSVPLRTYIGQMIKLRFTGTERNYYPTGMQTEFYVDDTALNAY